MFSGGSKKTQASLVWSEERTGIALHGCWTLRGIAKLSIPSDSPSVPEKSFTVDATSMEVMDTAGAMELVKFCRSIGLRALEVKWVGMKDSFFSLLKLVDEEWEKPVAKPSQERFHLFEFVGEETVAKFHEMRRFIRFFGHVFVVLISLLVGQYSFQWTLFAKNIEETGFRALPIVGLLTFLIGVVLAYQVVMQLSTYGASIYVVELTGIIMLREFGPIIAAIIIAGRTSTAFTAEIGTMKVSEEVDALTTLGIDPIERLVSPKVIGLIIVMPLLAVWADVFGVMGSMLMAKLDAGISFGAYLARFQTSVSITQLWLGLMKMPFFALMIAIVGCFQGFSVSMSAESVGRKTTHSAVQSIFLVIVLDAVFSVIFSVYGV